MLAALLAVGCGGAPDDVGALAAPIENAGLVMGETPVMGLVYRDSTQSHYGSAVLVSRNPPIAITAAHNLEPEGAETYQQLPLQNLRIVPALDMTAQLTDLTATPSLRVIAAAVPDGRKSASTYDRLNHDIALLLLEATADTPLPPPAVPLPRSLAVTADDEDTEFEVVGFGRPHPVRVGGRARSASFWLHPDYLDIMRLSALPPTFSLAQGTVGEPAVRSGDSGGGVFVRRCDQVFLAGVVSVGWPPSGVWLNGQDMVTRGLAVQVAFHEAWIIERIEEWLLVTPQ